MFFAPKICRIMGQDKQEILLNKLSSVDYIRGLKANESGNISITDLFQPVFYTSGENVESNIDDYKSSGIYGINRDFWPNTNAPIVYGGLLVFNGQGLAGGGNPIIQIAINHSAENIKIRVYWIRSWYPWRDL